MKYLVFLFLFIQTNAKAQPSGEDSLTVLLNKTGKDSNRVNLLVKISQKYYFFKPVISLKYSTEALDLARSINYTKGIISALSLAGEANRITGNYPASLKMQFEAYELSRMMNDSLWQAACLGFIGMDFFDLQEYDQAIVYLLAANGLFKNSPYDSRAVFTLINTGRSYNNLNKPDSALYYFQLATEANKITRHPQLASNIPLSIGDVFSKTGDTDSALVYFRQGLAKSLQSNESINLSRLQRRIAELYASLNKYDSAFYYAHLAFKDAERTTQKIMILESGVLLATLYRSVNKPDSALIYSDVVSAMKDSLYGKERFKQLQLLMLEEQRQEQQRVKEQEQYRTRVKFGWLYGTAGILLVLSFLFFNMYRQKQKSKNEVEAAYRNLKATQALLIQSEKMASLGELTAGIAHEIQNPLNFVNNFSEVSAELMIEAEGSRLRAAENNPEVSELLTDIKQNLEKINHHGKRADAIVKGMLQHSHAGTGTKELTDINALADEYLKLAVHGIRSKDPQEAVHKNLSAGIKTDFDPSIGKISIVPQDIGRVLLNLYNNAFWACSERSRKHETFQPAVWVSTKLNGDKVEITVKDNGVGIPEKIADKIFQPFFTTKPAGQGTGLGLSIAYDIVKAHGGELILDTREREFTQFIISLPKT